MDGDVDAVSAAAAAARAYARLACIEPPSELALHALPAAWLQTPEGASLQPLCETSLRLPCVSAPLLLGAQLLGDLPLPASEPVLRLSPEDGSSLYPSSCVVALLAVVAPPFVRKCL